MKALTMDKIGEDLGEYDENLFVVELREHFGPDGQDVVAAKGAAGVVPLAGKKIEVISWIDFHFFTA